MPVIIYGFRAVRWTTGEGQFFCPTCQSTASYRDRDVRLWFTLYFIPVVPLWRQGRVVACRGCRTEWDPAVLNYDPEAEAAHAAVNNFLFLLRSMALMAVMDGDLDEHETEMIRTILAEAGLERERQPDDATLAAEADLARQSGTTFEEYARSLAGDLAPDWKVRLLAAGYEVMMASPEPRKQQQLTAAATALGVSSEELLEIMHRVEERRDQQAGTVDAFRGA